MWQSGDRKALPVQPKRHAEDAPSSGVPSVRGVTSLSRARQPLTHRVCVSERVAVLVLNSAAHGRIRLLARAALH